jgi:hypothetical protein
MGTSYLLFVQRQVYSMAQDWIHVCIDKTSRNAPFGIPLSSKVGEIGK